MQLNVTRQLGRVDRHLGGNSYGSLPEAPTEQPGSPAYFGRRKHYYGSSHT